MLNVLEFRKTASQSRGSKTERLPENDTSDICHLVSRFTGLYSRASGEIHNAILRLDMAAQQAHRIAGRVRDPMARKSFDEHVLIIEQLLQRARNMALRL